MSKHFFFLILAALTLSTLQAEAKVFRNNYLAFELPDHWNCTLEQTEWTCRSGDAKETREAMIILTAKEVGPGDSFQIYENYLNLPIKVKSANSAGGQSKIIYKTKNSMINQHPWVDGLHLGSEVSTYYTRYLTTIKDSVAILVTFSAHKDYYTKYSQDFLKAVMSLRVIATKNLLANREQNGIRPPGTETIGIPGQAIPMDIVSASNEEVRNTKTSSLKYLGLAFILLAIGIFFYLRAKRKM